MSEYQIDPLKLNEVLQQILDKLDVFEDKSNRQIIDKLSIFEERLNNASPEFQVLMNSYLTKANEAERNKARFEECLERQELVQDQSNKLQIETEELKDRLKAYERDFDNLRGEHLKEVNNLREELSKVIIAKNGAEATVSEKYTKELSHYKSETEKRLSQMQEELTDALQSKRKLEEKLHFRSQEADIANRELDELKVKLADEQTKIRNEIIEVTQRSHQMEQKSIAEKEQYSKRKRELEVAVEELNNSLSLCKRELEYKDALLAQAIRQQGRVSDTFSSSYNINKAVTNLATDPQPLFSTAGSGSMNASIYDGNNYEASYESNSASSNSSIINPLMNNDNKLQSNKSQSPIGGIFSRLGS